MQETMILGILVFDRIKEAGKTQEVLTRHAEVIRSRLGFHELDDHTCSRVGTILLILQGKPEKWQELREDLPKSAGWRSRK